MKLFGFRFGSAHLPGPHARSFGMDRYQDGARRGIEFRAGETLAWVDWNPHWYDDVRLFGYSFGIHPASPCQRGLWRDRVDERLTRYGLGTWVLCRERIQPRARRVL